MPEPVAVLHSTESGDFDATVDFLDNLPGIQPHELYDPETDQAHTFIAWPRAAKALKNLPGGVETNNRPGGVFQVEILGYAAQAAQHSAQWYANLGAYLRRKAAEVGFRLEVNYPWTVSPTPKGTDPRLTPAQWYGLVGIIGHQRVPENNHSDPGDLSPLDKHLKETPTMEYGFAQLGPAIASMVQLYLSHRGQPPSTDEAHTWRQDMVKRCRNGENLEPVLDFIDYSLGRE